MMGLFATAGSLSRVLLPIISGYMDKVVKNSPFNIALFMLSLSYFGIVMLKPMIKVYIEVLDINQRSFIVESRDSIQGTRRHLYTTGTIWNDLSRGNKIQAASMIFLMIFAFTDLVKMS